MCHAPPGAAEGPWTPVPRPGGGNARFDSDTWLPNTLVAGATSIGYGNYMPQAGREN